MVHQLIRASGFRVSQSKFEPSLTVHSPIKLVCSLSLSVTQYPDPSICCQQALRYFRYHFGAERVLCGTWTPVAGDPLRQAELEVSLMLGIEDLQPWLRREANMFERNLGMDRNLVSITRVRPVDTMERQSNLPGSFNAVAVTVPQQWEREIESVAPGEQLPLQSVWWRLCGFMPPFEMHSRIQGVTLAGFQSHFQHTFTLGNNFVSAVAVLVLHVDSTQDAIALANVFDGRILGGLGRGSDKHIFPLKAAATDAQLFFTQRRSQPAWIQASPLLPKPPQIPSELFDMRVIDDAEEDADFALVLPAERWQGAKPRGVKKFIVSAGEQQSLPLRGFKAVVKA